MNLKKTNVLSFIQLSSLYKTKYHLPNQKILLQIIYSCSHLVNSLATFTQYRNQPIDFPIKELEKQIKLYQEHKPIELINQAPITFLNTKISVANQVFIPRVETEFVVNQAISLIKQHHFHHVFDLCCGSGAIGISIKKSVPTCTVTSVDINQQCILCTKRNAKANQTSIKAVCGDFIKTMINSKTKADIIVCNPPYVAKKDLCQQYFQYENKISFNNSADELYFYKTIIENIDRICNQKHFSIVFEIGYNQKQPLLKFLKTTPWYSYAKFSKDLQNNWRILEITYQDHNDVIRKEMLCKLNKGIKDKALLDKKINTWLIDFLTDYKAKYIALYYPLKIEPNILLTLKHLLDNKFKICLPCITNQRCGFKEIDRMNFPSETVHGIKQPTSKKWVDLEKIGVVVSPCVAYTGNYRLGYGTNFYNKLLTGKNHTTVLIGYKLQKHDGIQIKKHYLKYTFIKTF